MSDHPVALYRLGDRGAAVRSIRALLQAAGDLAPPNPQDGYSAEVSDVYDEEVAEAVRAFQQRRGLIVDGVLGPHTHIALDGAHWKLGDRLLSHIPGHMLQGDDVAELQERLLSLGFTPDRVDGVFGTNT
jgi:N-acetylmuramoyl-L-alanine amidase